MARGRKSGGSKAIPAGMTRAPNSAKGSKGGGAGRHPKVAVGSSKGLGAKLPRKQSKGY